MHKISIVLCTYNGEVFLKQQLDSILEQSLMPDELIIVDDNSDDNTVNLIHEITNDCTVDIKVIQNESRLGIVKNFDKALALSSGDYIFLSDQDDIWNKNKVKTMLAYMIDSEVINQPKLVYSDALIIDHSDNKISDSYMQYEKLKPKYDSPYFELTTTNFIPGCSMMMNRALVTKALSIPKEAVLHDWWLALIAALSGDILYAPEPLFRYRLHDNNAWGLDSKSNILNWPLASPTNIISRLKNNYIRSIRQANRAVKFLEKEGVDINRDYRAYLVFLSCAGVNRLKPFFKGEVERQGLVRLLLYFLGGLFSIRQNIGEMD